jgi:hypothetical protein
MKTKTSVNVALLSVATALILFSPTVFADSPPTALTLATPGTFAPPSFGGVITNAGNQIYNIQGGQAALPGWIFSTTVAQGANINFNLEANVFGLSTSGFGSLGVSNGGGNGWGNNRGNNQGKSQEVTIKINGEVSAATFPLGSSSPDSQIPFYFTGTATMTQNGQGNGNGNGHNHSVGNNDNDQSSVSVPIAIESAYWNPLGGPIVITSLDGTASTLPSIFLVISPSSATIIWSGVQVAGTLMGTYGSNSVTGNYVTTTYSFENLVAGTEKDAGQIAFSGFTDSNGNSVPQLDGTGFLTGSTTFTTAGGIDCSSETGVPGTCLLTGASSSGNFNMNTYLGVRISGSYATTWSIPSTFTSTTVTATVTQH